MDKPNPVVRLFEKAESRIGYSVLFRETRHFGYSATGRGIAIPLQPSLKELEDRLFEILNLPAGSRVLDLGCGAGRVAAHAVERGFEVEGIDLVDHHLDKARKYIQKRKMQDRIRVRKGDFQDLREFRDSSLDGAYSMGTVVHAPNPQQVFNEVFRVLRPGGRLAMSEYNTADKSKLSDYVEAFARRRRWYLPAGKMDEGQKRQNSEQLLKMWYRFNAVAAMPACDAWEPGVMETQLKQAGFEDVTIRDYTKNVKPTLRLVFALAYLPYLVISLLGLKDHFPHVVGAVYAYWGQELWTYVAVSARKPDLG
ncbi:methyltransferase type 11 [Elsinoe ampelina]|uniref:Methyltransferase type 11 n=1 Tax=Elsinoe ampelina TaxID=302913 RepID=A0A6A6GHT0_9PEZI|nr:methyltransferase type 11 [Elsinoe ampelina]